MMNPRRAVLFAAALMLAAPALAGEVNGSTTNPKDDFSNGVSICKFSGLNDDPTAPIDGPNGPGGRVQNFGHTQQIFDLDPQQFNPGAPGGCNANTDPFRDPGNPMAA
jgi:hypothetical protein